MTGQKLSLALSREKKRMVRAGTKSKTIREYGPLPQGWSTTPPEPSPEDQAAQRRARIMARLAEIDAASVRPLRALVRGEAVQADTDKLATLDAEAEELRAELAALEVA